MVGPSLLVLLVVGVVVAFLTIPGEETYVAPVPSAGPSVVDPAGAAVALQDLATALEQGDRDAVAALADPDDPLATERLGALAHTAAAARLTDVSMRYIAEDGPVGADGTWAAAVDVDWAYAGFDRVPTSAEVQVRFRSTPDGVAVAGVGGGTLRTPVWMSGPVQVSRSEDLLVLAAAGTDLATYEQRARTALPTVAGVLPDWPARLVVEVPADGAALEAALGAETGYYGQIAAVTGAGGAVAPGVSAHVFVNPDVFDGLGRIGQEVVLAHEATHVATDAPSSRAPTWLVEGFADYVALRDTPLPLSRTAAQAERQVRADGLPEALPSAAEFDTRGPHLGAVYEASWLVCVTLAERRDAATLARFHAAVSDGASLGTALREGFGWREADLVRAWRARLAALPGTP